MADEISTTQPTDAECIDKITSDPESAYRALLNQDSEIERLRALVIHYADQAGVPADEVRRVHNV